MLVAMRGWILENVYLKSSFVLRYLKLNDQTFRRGLVGYKKP